MCCVCAVCVACGVVILSLVRQSGYNSCQHNNPICRNFVYIYKLDRKATQYSEHTCILDRTDWLGHTIIPGGNGIETVIKTLPACPTPHHSLHSIPFHSTHQNNTLPIWDSDRFNAAAEHIEYGYRCGAPRLSTSVLLLSISSHIYTYRYMCKIIRVAILGCFRAIITNWGIQIP